MARKKRNPKKLRQTVWTSDSKYADLSHPEWLDQVPLHFWSDKKNHKRYVKWLFQHLKLEKVTDWYDVSAKVVHQNHGAALLQQYGGWINFLKAMYPKQDWQLWRFRVVPNGYWEDKENQQAYVVWLGKQVGFKKPEDWYQIRQNHVIGNKGRTLYQKLRGNLANFAKLRYPDFDFKPWLFREVPDGYWNVKKNRRAFIVWLEDQIGIKEKSDWYQYTIKVVETHQGRGLANRFRGSLIRLLKDVYPKIKWVDWYFKVVSLGFWRERENRQRYMKWLGKKLGFRSMEDWYQIKYVNFQANRGVRMINTVYDGDFIKAIQDCFPEYQFHPWLFPIFPGYRWEDAALRKQYMKWLGDKLGFEKKEDWYQLNTIHFTHNFGSRLLYGIYEGSVLKAVQDYRPKWKLDESKFNPRALSNKKGAVEKIRKRDFVRRKELL